MANKADSEQKAHSAVSYYELGLDEVMPISALHGRGIGDLEEAIADRLPEVVEDSGPDLDVPRVAIIGRPNAGKSSLVNRLCGEERQLVDNRPGTTVDSVDTLIERAGRRLILIDTAGIRRKRSVKKRGVESLSVLQAIRSIERSDIVVLMIDAETGVGEQDAKIAGLAHDRGRALIIALNKVDLLARDEQKKAMDRTREILAFVPWAPLVTVSALKGSGVNALLGRIDDAIAEHRKRISTAELNRFFEEVLETTPSPNDAPPPGSFVLRDPGHGCPAHFRDHDQRTKRRSLQLPALRGEPNPQEIRFSGHARPSPLSRQEAEGVAMAEASATAAVARRDRRAAHKRPSLPCPSSRAAEPEALPRGANR